MQHRFIRSGIAGAAALLMAVGVAACSSDSGSDSKDSVSAGSKGAAIGAKRCAENKAAGKVTYLSGYGYQSSVSILEYVAAAKLGYFKDLCLDVALKPGSGDTAQNTKLLASGQASISAVAEQDIIQAQNTGVNIEGISSYSNAGLDILMTNKNISSLTQLDNKVVGHKGYVPAAVEAMMVKAGVNWKSLHLVKEGYDPTVLVRHQGGLQALTGFISNEPNQLKAKGDAITVWNPADYGVPSSLGAMAVNPAFAKAHPHAVEDLLRGALKAYAYCSVPKNVSQCVGYAAKLDGTPGYDKTLNASIWKTETDTVKKYPTPGDPLGGIDPGNVAKIVYMLQQQAIIPASVTAQKAEGWFDTSFIRNIYKGDKLIWPAP